MRVEELFQPPDAKSLALDTYGEAYRRHLQAKVDAMQHGDKYTASLEDADARIVKRAYIAEQYNPMPEGLT